MVLGDAVHTKQDNFTIKKLIDVPTRSNILLSLLSIYYLFYCNKNITNYYVIVTFIIICNNKNDDNKTHK